MKLTRAEWALLVSAEEDYLTLADAALEMLPAEDQAARDLATTAIRHLLEQGLVYASELVETSSSGRTELRRLSAEELIAGLSDPKKWQQWSKDGIPYIALAATHAALEVFSQGPPEES